MSFNFSNFKPVTKTYTKEGGNFTGREALVYDMRYRRFMSNNKVGDEAKPHEDFLFEIGAAKFVAMGIDGADKGIIQMVYNDGVSYIAVVDNANATLLKTTKRNEGKEKGRKFRADIIETALSEQGLIDLKIIGDSQFLALNLVEGSEGVTLGEGPDAFKTYGLYEIVKAEAPVETKAEPAVSSAPETAPAETSEAPVVDESAAPEAPAAETAAPAESVVPASPSSEDDF